ncbi:Serine aminopeptidase, S33/Alpha/beta hydrolase family/alpha/beta hydrolase fold, putative, partial [Plasmodium berghei]
WKKKKKKKKKKTNKNENENETAKDKNNNDDEKFITYKIPKYLRKRNIKCPFIYKQVFYGKYGIVNYDLQGINKETLVITFHGLNGTNLTFLEIQKILIRYKFQVLNFDLYGHGLSACPKYNHRNKTYGIDFFLSQTEELLTHLNLLNRNFYLIGFSMGCIIATNFAKKYIK